MTKLSGPNRVAKMLEETVISMKMVNSAYAIKPMYQFISILIEKNRVSEVESANLLIDHVLREN